MGNVSHHLNSVKSKMEAIFSSSFYQADAMIKFAKIKSSLPTRGPVPTHQWKGSNQSYAHKHQTLFHVHFDKQIYSKCTF